MRVYVGVGACRWFLLGNCFPGESLLDVGPPDVSGLLSREGVPSARRAT